MKLSIDAFKLPLGFEIPNAEMSIFLAECPTEKFLFIVPLILVLIQKIGKGLFDFSRKSVTLLKIRIYPVDLCFYPVGRE
jgi:hypothetical protein